MSDTKKVICFGEVLWDMLPSGKVAGGAPMNVAYHLRNLGLETLMLSCVGKDQLGTELLEFLNCKNISTDFIQISENHDTGTVEVKLDQKGSPTYTIIESVAWDCIRAEESDVELVKESDAFVYGSLAARSEVSKSSLLKLLEFAPFKVFDLNLRSPFYSDSLIEQLLKTADLIKLSDEELEELSSQDVAKKSERERLEILMDLHDLKGIILTKGKDGAVFLDRTGYYEQGIFPITVVDTIGSGDAFLSGFLSQYLTDQAIPKALEYGAAMGALVATHSGGTPAIDVTELTKFVNEKSTLKHEISI